MMEDDFWWKTTVDEECPLCYAMSSSRSDIVTQFICSSIRPSVRPFFPFVYLESVEYLEYLRASKSVKEIWLNIKGGCKEVLRKVQDSCKEFLRKCHWFSMKFQGCFKDISSVFQGHFKCVSMKIEGCSKKY